MTYKKKQRESIKLHGNRQIAYTSIVKENSKREMGFGPRTLQYVAF